MSNFNKDLDGYLGRRRAMSEPVQEKVQEKEEEDFVELEHEAEPEEEEFVEEKRDGVFVRFFRKIGLSGGGSVEEEVEVVEQTDTSHDEDVRMVLKLSYQWLSYLPKSKLDSFKESQDFETYKNVLKKYGLIK